MAKTKKTSEEPTAEQTLEAFRQEQTVPFDLADVGLKNTSEQLINEKLLSNYAWVHSDTLTKRI